MIAISYFWLRDSFFDMEVFNTKEEAKQWLTDVLLNKNFIREWYDDIEDKYYEKHEDIRELFEKYTLEEIVEGAALDGELHIIMKEM